MTHVTSKLTTVLAGLTLAGLPVVGAAQSSTAPQPTTPTRMSRPQPSRSTDQSSAQHHLDEAKRVLNSIDGNSLQGEARAQVTELRRHFTQLESAWRSRVAGAARSGAASTGHASGHTGGTTTGSTGTTTSGTATGATAGTTGTPEQAGATGTPVSRQAPRTGSPGGAANDDWMRHYQAIDSLLDRLLGDSSAVSGGAGVSAGATAGTTGSTTGSTAVGASAVVNLDAAARAKLAELRSHIDLFHAAAMSPSGPEADTAVASPHGGITGAMTRTPGSSGTSAMGQPTTATPETISSTTASANVDSAAIARLSAQIDELLRGTSTTSGTAGTTSRTTGSTATTGMTGAAAATGTVCVDRAKLEQLKRDIQALRQER